MIHTRNDHMKYQEGMDILESDLMERVLTYSQAYDDQAYDDIQILQALDTDDLSLEQFGALLSSPAAFYLEEMAQKSKMVTAKQFGNAVTIFTPLYIANYCENHCVYCGFNCKNKIRRGKLSEEEIEKEMQSISKTGFKEILILTGECRRVSGPEYIGKAVEIAKKYFTAIGIEVYPMNIDEYRYLHECGADFISIYQETYDTNRYEQVHLSGSKRVFPYRFDSQERAVLGGMRGVAFGSLLGLGDFRKDAFAAGVHAFLLQKKYPHAEISFSFPRLRPYMNREQFGPNDVGEKQLLQTMLAYRLFMPYAGSTISTRERAGFRDHVVGLAATKISAGVNVGVGGHSVEAKGDEQFDISDNRSVDEVRRMLLSRGMQPVFTDYIRV